MHAINEQRYDSDHPSFSISLNNYANHLRVTGAYEQAEQLLRQALSIEEKVFGAEHSYTATICSNLANVLRDTGNFIEAESLYERAIAIHLETYSSDHFALGIDRGRYALLLDKAGRKSEAEPFYRQALTIFFRFQQRNGNPYQRHAAVEKDYRNHLAAQGLSTEAIEAQLMELRRTACKDLEADVLRPYIPQESVAVATALAVRISDGADFLTFQDIPSDWQEELSQLLAQLSDRLQVPAQFRKLRHAQLPFYAGGYLIAIEHIGLQDHREKFALYWPQQELVLLNWTNEQIYAANERHTISFDDDQAIAYCRFFFYFVSVQLGEFKFLHKTEQFPWTSEPDIDLLAQIKHHLFPLHILQREEKILTLEGSVLFKNALFTTKIRLAMAPTQIIDEENTVISFSLGEMQLFAEELLLEDLPVAIPTPPDKDGWKAGKSKTVDMQARISDEARFLAFQTISFDDVQKWLEHELTVLGRRLQIPPQSRILRAASLPFYKNGFLLAIEHTGIRGRREKFALYWPHQELVLLDWTNQPIYAANKRYPMRFDGGKAFAYCQFFFHFVRGKSGLIIIAQHLEQFPWLAEPAPELLDNIQTLLIPLRVIQEEPKITVLESTVILQGSLYKTKIRLATQSTMIPSESEGDDPVQLSGGNLELFDQELLIENLPIMIDAAPGVFG